MVLLQKGAVWEKGQITRDPSTSMTITRPPQSREVRTMYDRKPRECVASRAGSSDMRYLRQGFVVRDKQSSSYNALQHLAI